MSLTNSQYDAIMRSYEEKQRAVRRRLEQNTETVYRQIPAYEELDRQVAAISIEQGRKLLGGNENALPELRARLKELSMKKSSLLREYGFPEDFLSPVYECDKCRDTGYIANRKCSCFRAAEINLIYEQSHIKSLLMTENFGALSYDYYAGEDLEKFTKAVQICQNFVKSFNKGYRNLFFYGTVGTGKSFLSCCVAKELIDRGNLVLYFSASQLFDILSKSTFDKDSPEAVAGISDDICGCDLLIIDDLGAECATKYTAATFFNLLNTRLINGKPTIINTNLDRAKLEETYGERVLSRLLGEFRLLLFVGKDVRMQKLSERTSS